jgi:GTP-binding protein
MYQQLAFVSSIFDHQKCPPDVGAEIAIAGRSNAGKSSLINCLTNQTKLSRISKTPGRTQSLNFFQLPNHNRIIDLPGYGYAKTGISMRQQWGILISKYLQTRKSLKAVVVVMDIRHPLQQLDKQLLDWLTLENIDIYCVLTKADKFSYGKSLGQLAMVKKMLSSKFNVVGIQNFSSLKRKGIDDLRNFLDQYLLV